MNRDAKNLDNDPPKLTRLAISSLITRGHPFKHAICSGVFPYTFLASISPPASIKMCTHSTLPEAAAACNGVYRSRSLT